MTVDKNSKAHEEIKRKLWQQNDAIGILPSFSNRKKRVQNTVEAKIER